MSRLKKRRKRWRTKMGDGNCSILQHKKALLQQTAFSSTVLDWRKAMDHQSVVWVVCSVLIQQSINLEINLLTNQDSRTRTWNWPGQSVSGRLHKAAGFIELYYMYRQLKAEQLYNLPTQLYFCVVCEYENKQRLFPYTTLTDWIL